MPHVVILYTPNLDAPPRSNDAQPSVDMTGLCRALADVMCAEVDEAGAKVFPTGGVRVLAYPAAHFAVADGKRDYAFMYLNLRMGRGRSAAVQQSVGAKLEATAKRFVAPLMAHRSIGVTLQIDVGAEVFDAKNSSIHPLFQ